MCYQLCVCDNITKFDDPQVVLSDRLSQNVTGKNGKFNHSDDYGYVHRIDWLYLRHQVYYVLILEVIFFLLTVFRQPTKTEK